MNNYLALAELAKAATPGPWRSGANGGYGLGPINAVYDAQSDVYGDLIATLQTVPPRPEMEANAAYIAAASPDVVLALVADNTRLAAENELAQSNLGKYMAAATELQAQLDAAVALTADLAGKLGALQSQEPVAWETQSGSLTGLTALNGSKHDGKLYGWKPLFAAAGAQPAHLLTDAECRAKFEAWYASAPDAEAEPERTYELTDESMSELTKDCIWLGWQAAHGIAAQPAQGEKQ